MVPPPRLLVRRLLESLRGSLKVLPRSRSMALDVILLFSAALQLCCSAVLLCFLMPSLPSVLTGEAARTQPTAVIRENSCLTASIVNYPLPQLLAPYSRSPSAMCALYMSHAFTGMLAYVAMDARTVSSFHGSSSVS